MKTISLRLTDNEADSLAKLQEVSGLNSSEVIRRALRFAAENPGCLNEKVANDMRGEHFLSSIGFLPIHGAGKSVFFQTEIENRPVLALATTRTLSHGESASIWISGKKIENFRQLCVTRGYHGFLVFRFRYCTADDWTYCVTTLADLGKEFFSFSEVTGDYHLKIKKVPEKRKALSKTGIRKKIMEEIKYEKKNH